jgi:predicted SAM-dependent methyltransferase
MSQSIRKKLLNLCCGNRFHQEWINIDFTSSSEYVRTHNLLKGIPYPDNYFDVVYHNNALEHFQKNDGERFIQECYRVLKLQGIIRIVVPDLENIVRCYLEQLEKAVAGDKTAEYNYDWIMLEMYDQTVRNYSGGAMADYLQQEELKNEEFIFQRCGNAVKDIRKAYLSGPPIIPLKRKLKQIVKKMLNRIVGEAYVIGRFRLSGEIHQWMYDRFSLQRLLINTGFSNAEIKSPYESSVPDWQRYELDSNDNVIHAPNALYIEARKPPV